MILKENKEKRKRNTNLVITREEERGRRYKNNHENKKEDLSPYLICCFHCSGNTLLLMKSETLNFGNFVLTNDLFFHVSPSYSVSEF